MIIIIAHQIPSTKLEDICIPTFLGQFCMHLIVKHDLHDHWFDCGENEVFVGFNLWGRGV